MAARRIPLAILAALALVLGTVSLAWACGPNRAIELSAFSGPAGSSLTVFGANWNPGDIRTSGAPISQRRLGLIPPSVGPRRRRRLTAEACAARRRGG